MQIVALQRSNIIVRVARLKESGRETTMYMYTYVVSGQVCPSEL